MQNALAAAPPTGGVDEDDCPAPLVGTSPSALDTFGVEGFKGFEGEACERKWGWDKICGIRKAPSASAEDGSKIHTVLENYLMTGVIDHSDPRIGAIASSGTHLLPPLVHEIEVKGRFHSPRNPLIVYRLRKDFGVHPFNWDENGQPTPGRGRPLIGDHKSTKSIDSYAKSERDLHRDIQAVVYAKSEIDRWAPYGVDAVDGLWVYYETGKVRRAEVRRWTMGRDEIEKSFEKIELRAERIASIVQASRASDATPEAKRLRVLSLPYNAQACTAFGGCPYQGQCNLSPAERLSASFRGFMSMQNAPNGFATQFAQAPGPMPAAAQFQQPQQAPPPPMPQAPPPGVMPTHAPNGLPLPPTVVDTGTVFDAGSNAYYDVRQIIASHGYAAIAPLLDASALRHQQTAAPQAPPAPPPQPAAAPTPVPSFLQPGATGAPNYAVNPPEGAAPPPQPAAPSFLAPPAADHDDGEDAPKGKAAIQAKIDAEVLAGTFRPAPPYARTGKGRRTHDEIEQDLRWQKTQALGLQPPQPGAPLAQQPQAPAPTGFISGPIVAQADKPITGWLADYTKYSALAANALAQHLSGGVK